MPPRKGARSSPDSDRIKRVLVMGYDQSDEAEAIEQGKRVKSHADPLDKISGTSAEYLGDKKWWILFR